MTQEFEARHIDKSKILILLDPGHGEEPPTPGKRSPGKKGVNDGRPGIIEGEFNRDVVRRVVEMLWSRGIQAMDILLGSKESISLTERVRRANEINETHRCIFISVHANAKGMFGWHDDANGFRVFRKKKASKATVELASLMRAQMSLDIPEWRGKSFIKKKGFKVIAKTTMPAILTENGFMTHRDDVKILETSEGRDRIAAATCTAIGDFIAWSESQC